MRPMWNDSTPGVAVGRGGLAVDPPEHQRRVAQLELGEPADDGLVDDIPLVAGLVGATPPHLGERPHPERVLAGTLQAPIRVVQVRLLRREVRVVGGHAPSCGGPPKGTDHLTGCSADSGDHHEPEPWAERT